LAEGRAEPALGDDRVGVITLPMGDTVKEVVDGKVRRTVPRDTLVKVIGPWFFDREALVDVLARVAGSEADITDMIGLCHAAHVRVRVLSAR
jgi:2-C-methyl-D-erythritol 4-phosphate cytidylyltransferase